MRSCQEKDTTLAQRLKSSREDAGLTQIQAAEKIESSVRNLQAWERGRGKPHRLVLRELSRIYSVDVDWLLDGIGQMKILDEDKRLAIQESSRVERFIAQKGVLIPENFKPDETEKGMMRLIDQQRAKIEDLEAQFKGCLDQLTALKSDQPLVDYEIGDAIPGLAAECGLKDDYGTAKAQERSPSDQKKRD